jgi:methyl-accepting chemotaxis protein
MNASIEAAHAGSAGKGFGVIAHEIKRLAQASAERSSRIGAIIGGIETAVGEGVEASSSVSDALASITEGAAQTSVRISEAATEAARQRESGEGILVDSRALAASAVKMMEEAAKESTLSGNLESSQGAVAESTAAIVDRNAELARRARSLESLAGRARKAADDLVAAMSR